MEFDPRAWWRTRHRRPLVYGVCSDTGRVRTENQDACGRFPAAPDAQEQLFIVADGMGGHARGREASQIAVHIVQHTFFALPGRPAAERLRTAFEAANARVYQEACRSGWYETMGTTCTALALAGGRIEIAHVGDSRAYRINHAGVRKLTQDHNLIEAFRARNKRESAEAGRFVPRNVLTRAVGVAPALEVDTRSVGAPGTGDCFLLCTDGLNEVSEAEMQRIVLFNPPPDACEKLVEIANARGGRDNITVLLIRFD